jgi:hypothetical protein
MNIFTLMKSDFVGTTIEMNSSFIRLFGLPKYELPDVHGGNCKCGAFKHAARDNQHKTMREIIPLISADQIVIEEDWDNACFDLETWKILYSAGIRVKNAIRHVKDAEVAKFLLEQGEKDDENNTALVRAMTSSRHAVVKLFIDRGAQPSADQVFRYINVAIMFGSRGKEILSVFESGISFNEYGEYALERARKLKNHSAEETLIKMFVRNTLKSLTPEAIRNTLKSLLAEVVDE